MKQFKIATPYMLRNDGTCLKCGESHPYIRYIFESDIEILDKFKNKDQTKIKALNWFLNNTKKENLKNLILIIAKYFDLFDVADSVYKCYDSEILDFINSANNDSNQEFLRLRMSNIIYGGDSNELYARISSLNFNWYPLLYNLLLNKNIENITITKDSNTFGGKFKTYKINNQECYHLDIKSFLTLKRNPIIETVNTSLEIIDNAYQELCEGKSISEAYSNLAPRHVNGFYNRHKELFLDRDLNNSQK